MVCTESLAAARKELKFSNFFSESGLAASSMSMGNKRYKMYTTPFISRVGMLFLLFYVAGILSVTGL